ncbi:unnamed protein product [Trichogramma brassicae]|uniref:Reverse transcriptase domain-containing protein n=1 Tax=Trichogramma brassicae TaxID=86971 RepID=A0A6H5J3H4_9HYME|nr:unnamed protein product [Trichogramma brassicae]
MSAGFFVDVTTGFSGQRHRRLHSRGRRLPSSPSTERGCAQRSAAGRQRSDARYGKHRAKLPTIVIADFSGDIEDWVRFRDTFKEMVIERPNLPNIYKMNYLRSYVKGEAAELLQEVPSGGEHFADAWQVLKGRKLGSSVGNRERSGVLFRRTEHCCPGAGRPMCSILVCQRGAMPEAPIKKARSQCASFRHRRRSLEQPFGGGRDYSAAFPVEFQTAVQGICTAHDNKVSPSTVLSRSNGHISRPTARGPRFHQLGRIDLLLGTQIARVVQEGLRVGNESMPIATNSRLGPILSGNINDSDTGGSIVYLQTEGHLDDLLRSFWEVEEPPHAPLLSAEDKMCEEHYVNTTVRLPDGRYQVRLPQKPNAPIDWVNSRQIAKSCLLSLERKFSRNPSLRSDYVAAMNQMVQSNQMRKVSIEPQDYGSHYFLPHHAVVKESSTTTRVRPVFNASARNAAGHSLNENLLTGPNLLPQLVLVLAHWRCYPIAFVADVSKMYLQVRLHPEDWKLQSILWREDPRESIEHYVLTTVTFGCGPSAYLASRTLRKLAEDDGNKFPLAPPIVRHEMYMDDVLSGAFDLNTASEKRRHLCSLFSAGGFSLAKWMTNDRELLSSFDPSDRATEATLKVGLGFSVLGLVWEPQADRFYFNVSMTPLTGAITKRKVLSRIAGLFDPSGWISPSLIPLKIFMQSLRLLTKEWDVALPDAETAQWRAYEDDLQGLPSISIPRWSGVTKSARLELHGFADASKLAYAAVLYVRLLHGGGARVTLLASKTKRQTIHHGSQGKTKQGQVVSKKWTQGRINVERHFLPRTIVRARLRNRRREGKNDGRVTSAAITSSVSTKNSDPAAASVSVSTMCPVIVCNPAEWSCRECNQCRRCRRCRVCESSR